MLKLAQPLLEAHSAFNVPGLEIDYGNLQDWEYLPESVVMTPTVAIRWDGIPEADKSTTLQKIADFINSAVATAGQE